MFPFAVAETLVFANEYQGRLASFHGRPPSQGPGMPVSPDAPHAPRVVKGHAEVGVRIGWSIDGDAPRIIKGKAAARVNR